MRKADTARKRVYPGDELLLLGYKAIGCAKEIYLTLVAGRGLKASMTPAPSRHICFVPVTEILNLFYVRGNTPLFFHPLRLNHCCLPCNPRYVNVTDVTDENQSFYTFIKITYCV